MNEKDDKVIDYQVNGEIFQTTKEILTVREIMESAGAKAGINIQDLDNYYLTDLDKNIKYDDLNKEVKLYEGIKFLATYKGKTPVA